jgi:hypothetical protein
MNSAALTKINAEVYRRFPELEGVKPQTKKLDQNTLLIYQQTIDLAGKKKLNRTVRVVVDDQNQIMKVSTSR